MGQVMAAGRLVLAILIGGMLFLQGCVGEIHEEIATCIPTRQFADVCNDRGWTIFVDGVFISPGVCETIDITPASCQDINTDVIFTDFVISLEPIYPTLIVTPGDDTILIF